MTLIDFQEDEIAEMLTIINTCSVVMMASIIMILGVVRTVASMRQEQDTQSVESGPKQLQSRGELGEMGPDHHNSEVMAE